MRRIILLIITCLFIAKLAFCAQMKITSPVFDNNGFIPAKYTCQGEDINPPLVIESLPQGTKTLVLIVDDPDAPVRTWVHWVVYNIEPVTQIKENSVPGTEVMNDSGKIAYHGPCPPSGIHRYFFKIYALDSSIERSINSAKDLEKAMQGHILASSELIGLYKKH